MASQTQAQEPQSRARSSKRTGARRSKGRSGTRRTARRSTTTEVRDLERMIRGLESRIAQLTSAQTIRSTVNAATGQVGRAVTGATDHVGDLVTETLTHVAGQLRGGAGSVADAARVGTNLVSKVSHEMERRPMMTVAVALGLGFLVGLVGRRTDTAA